MKNCLVLGFGRSGTSLMGGILHEAGYYMGENLYQPRHSNPKGFFENAVINGINEGILAQFDNHSFAPATHQSLKEYSPFKPNKGQRWLSYIPANAEIECSDINLITELKHEASKANFAYKDPRFSYTLPIWDKYLPRDTVYICIFRDPAVTVHSIMTECRSVEYLNSFYINNDLAIDLWLNCYIRVIGYNDNYAKDKLVFVNYEQLISGRKIDQLSELLEVKLTNKFVDKNLKRSTPMSKKSNYATCIYETLCKFSNY